MCYAVVFFSFQVAWMIYGNTFQFTADSLACLRASRETRQVWVLTMILLCIGYVYFLIVACGLCLGCSLCVLMLAQGATTAHDEAASHKRYQQVVKTLNRKIFGESQAKVEVE